jgi:hypothetical protein
MKLQKLFFAAVIVLSANAAFAQNDTDTDSHNVTINIPQIALLDLETLSSLDFTLGADTSSEAGLAVSFAGAVNSDTWINYTSLVSGTSTNKVMVSLDTNVPTGLKLTVAVGADAGNGAGAKGVVAVGNKYTLTTASTDIITTIGSGYTGDGSGSGHNLTYQLGYAADATTNFADLVITDTPLLITYTILTE